MRNILKVFVSFKGLFVILFFAINAAPLVYSKSKSSGQQLEQGTKANWQKNSFEQKAFIENKGQFISDDHSSTEILYAAEFGSKIYFTKNGFIFSMMKAEIVEEEEKEKKKKSKNKVKEEEEEVRKINTHIYDVAMEWMGANPGAKLVAEEKVREHWSYINPRDPAKGIDQVAGYQKLIYKNIYPGIDVQYIFSEKGGVKYSIVLHPGADASQIKMKYTGANKVYRDQSGNICFKTPAGFATDHAPETFYETGGASIPSGFILEKNIVSFNLGNYDNTRPVIIDPWLNSSLSPATTVVESAADSSNNLYIYGFTGLLNTLSPAQHFVQKYNSAGVLQWTYNFFLSMNYENHAGDLTVDPAGNVFVTCGFYSASIFSIGCMLSKLNTTGALQWNLKSPFLYENYRVNFNCDYSQLIQLGCGPSCCNVGKGDIIDIVTGSETNLFAPPNIGDVVASSYGKNGYLYVMTVKEISSNPPPITPHLTCLDPATGFSIVWSIDYPMGATFIDGFVTNYGTNGFNGLAAGCNFLFVNIGDTLEKRDLNTGALYAGIALPGGVRHGNAGTVVDDCGNVFVGSSQGIYVYDSNLSLLTTFAAPYPVFDIVLGKGGIFYANGGVPSASSNSGFIGQFSMSSVCNPIIMTSTPNVCGTTNTASATATPVFCTAPYTYSWSTSPAQTTQTATGLSAGTYSVMVTGAGVCNETHTATVNINSGILIINVPPDYYLCGEGGSSVMLTASGGTTYTWSPAATLSDSTIANPLASPFVTTTYTVIVSNGICSDTAFVTVHLVASPASPIIIINGDTLTTSKSYSSYQWYFNGSPIPLATDSFYIAKQTGTYALQTTDSLGCSIISNGVYVFVTSVSEIRNGSSDFVIYPNPAGNELVISHLALVIDEINIHNVLGEKVYSLKSEISDTGPETTIDISSFAKGVYIVELKSGNKVYHTKVVKE